MKERIWRLSYVFLAIVVGYLACSIRSSEGGKVSIAIYLLVMGLSIGICLAIKDQYLNTTTKLIIGLVVGIVLIYPIAYVLQYLVAVLIVLKDIAGWLLQFKFVKAISAGFVTIVIILIITFVYDQIKYDK